MADKVSRRQTMAAATELPSGVDRSDVSEVMPSRFQIQNHLICIDGRRTDENQWRMKVGLRGKQRGWITPTDSFLQRLWEVGIPVTRAGLNLLIAERVTLPNGVAGLCLLIESTFPATAQNHFCELNSNDVVELEFVKRVWINCE